MGPVVEFVVSAVESADVGVVAVPAVDDSVAAPSVLTTVGEGLHATMKPSPCKRTIFRIPMTIA